MQKFFKFIITYLIVYTLYRVEFIGAENIPKETGFLMCANHVGKMDMFVQGIKINNKIRYMAKEELFKNKLISWWITAVGAFPVKRNAADISALKKAIGYIKNKEVVGIYPEGTRSLNSDREEKVALPGVAFIALKANAPILPVKIEGNNKLFSKIVIKYGKPFFLDVELDRRYSSKELSDLSEDIMKKVYSL